MNFSKKYLIPFILLTSTSSLFGALENWEKEIRITNHILLDVPDKITTERLILRPPQAGDGKAMQEAMVETSDALLKYWEPYKYKPTIEQTEIRARRDFVRFHTREALTYLIFEKEKTVCPKTKSSKKQKCTFSYGINPGILVGYIKLHTPLWDVPQFSFSYWARTSAQGKGFITEAARKIMDMAFEQLKVKKLIIEAEASNTKSIAIAERLNFKLVKKPKRHAADGSEKYVDWVSYELTYEDYKKRSIQNKH